MPRSRKNVIRTDIGSGQILAPDGEILCSVDRQRIRWYLDHEPPLAEVIREEPLQIRLFFEPKGRRHASDPCFIAIKHFLCVVCDAKESLTRHHIVPYCYRKYMPESIKTHSSYDVMLVCRECHDRYEAEAFKFKTILGNEFSAPIALTCIVDKELLRAKKAANAILRNGHLMPPERRGKLEQTVATYFGVREITDEHFKKLSESEPNKPVNELHGELVAKQLDTREKWHEFTVRWRRHFLEVLNPQHLSPHWHVDKVLV